MLLCIGTASSAQEKKSVEDTTLQFLTPKKGLFEKLVKSITNNNPVSEDTAIVTINNITPFALYRGAIIRSVNIVNVRFGESVNDTAIKKKNLFDEIGNSIHRKTRKTFINNNLFFKAGEELSPYLVADNERFLRDQPYLQDARIQITGISPNDDSVDLTVFYKDVFSISGSGDAGSGNSVYAEVQDENFLGDGQRVKIENLYDLNRRNRYAFGMEYVRRNIAHTFANITMGYQGNAPAFNSGRREETTVYSSLDLPLVSPYALWTGSFNAALHYTTNQYINDSLYNANFKYRYASYDLWAGYNISARRLLHETTSRKTKDFVALRLVKNDFLEIPNIYETQYNFQYANLVSVLGAFTRFKQDYYRTNFIYGFGRNEDIPSGYNVSALAGWTNKQGYTRPYAGFDLQKYVVTPKQAFFNYELKFGGYFNDGNFQDISFLASLESFSRLRRLGNSRWLVRHFINGSFTQQINTFLNESLRVNSAFGIPSFNNIIGYNGSSRATGSCESVFYNTWKFFGFSFAPFAFGNVSYLKPIGQGFSYGDVYTAWGGGVRTRNENLVFGTIELRIQYFPRTTVGMSPWNIGIQSNLQFKYNSQYIKKPDFVTVN
ncbi:MAG: hypothetical protein EKK39_05695 [Sphingobacteriales bacterium]|uniref:hypothetical protein n=1 Tax=Hydrotalea flava TaxID=714549 RepID=UPI00082A3349|nr:hypothetical protein [Hydrotalea flava]RTL53316.1 MAG: hypothetical protein EKK39_05695 [Sphingobacteriales bacterium]